MWRIPKGRFTRDVGTRFLVQGVGLCISLVTGAVTARWLGQEGKGLLSLTTLLPSFMGLFLGAGLMSANVYFIGSGRFGIRALTANSILVTIATTFIGFAIVALLIVTGAIERIVPNCPVELILVGFCMLPFGVLAAHLGSILQGLRCIKTLGVISIVQQTVALGLIVFLVAYMNLGVLGALVAGVAASLLSIALNTTAVLKEGGTLRPHFDLAVIKATLAYGIRGHVGNLLQYFNYRLDVFIVNFFMGPAEVGIYGVAVTMAEVLWFLPDAVGFVIFPKSAGTSTREMNTFTPRVFKYVLAFTAFSAAVLAIAAKPLIPLVFSKAFNASYMPMLALLPGVVLLGGAKVLTNEIAGRGHPGYNSLNAGVCLVITVIADLLLIPRHGAIGAAAASSIAYASTFFIALCCYRIISRRQVIAHAKEIQ